MNLLLLPLLFGGVSGLTFRTQREEGPIIAGADKQPAPVFYAIIMGKLAFRHQVSMWLGSLRTSGGWKGEAVIVTDKPFCLAKTLEEAKMLGPKLSSTKTVDIYGPPSGQSGNLHIVKRPVQTNVKMMKLEKARAWHNMAEAAIPHKVTSIVYTDEDVVMGKDLTKFLEVVKGLEQSPKPYSLAVFRDKGLAAGELHTGIVIMFPGKHTNECLRAWGKELIGVDIGPAPASLLEETPRKLNEAEIAEQGQESNVETLDEHEFTDEESEEMGPDQQALGRTKECRPKAADNTNGIAILPTQHLMMPTAARVNRGSKAEFVHFTNTGRWGTISAEQISAYLVKIGAPGNIDPKGHVMDKQCAESQ